MPFPLEHFIAIANFIISTAKNCNEFGSFHKSKIVLFSNFIQKFSEKKNAKRYYPTAKRAVVKSKTLLHQFRPSVNVVIPQFR